MKQEIIIKLDRKEIIDLIMEKYKVTFYKNRLSHDGFKGWVDEK